MAFTETDIVNAIAAQERAIAGIKDSFDFAKNPDRLDKLPVVLHYIPRFESGLRAHHNQWDNNIQVKSLLFVMPRQSGTGQLRLLENAAIPFGEKWRARFQTDSVVSGLLTSTAAVRCFLESGDYGAGGPELTFGDIEFVGWTFLFTFRSA